MGSARRILDSVQIMLTRAEQDHISVIVSAVAGVSNSLQDSIDGCIAGGNPVRYIEAIRLKHTEICTELTALLPCFASDTVITKLAPIFETYERLLTAVAAFGECPVSVHCRIMGLGELLCAPIV